jgi:hypothetical protein
MISNAISPAPASCTSIPRGSGVDGEEGLSGACGSLITRGFEIAMESPFGLYCQIMACVSVVTTTWPRELEISDCHGSNFLIRPIHYI